MKKPSPAQRIALQAAVDGRLKIGWMSCWIEAEEPGWRGETVRRTTVDALLDRDLITVERARLGERVPVAEITDAGREALR